MRLPLSALLLVGLAACFEEDANVLATDDSGGATGAGDAGEETDEDCPWEVRDGLYQGEIIILGSAVDLVGSAETCVGTVTLDVDAEGEPQIEGMASCTFSGWLDWMGEQSLALTGVPVGPDGAEGSLAVTIEGVTFEEEWAGAWEGDSLSAWFSGTELYSLGGAEFEVLFEGSFTARRVE